MRRYLFIFILLIMYATPKIQSAEVIRCSVKKSNNLNLKLGKKRYYLALSSSQVLDNNILCTTYTLGSHKFISVAYKGLFFESKRNSKRFVFEIFKLNRKQLLKAFTDTSEPLDEKAYKLSKETTYYTLTQISGDIIVIASPKDSALGKASRIYIYNKKHRIFQLQ